MAKMYHGMGYGRKGDPYESLKNMIEQGIIFPNYGNYLDDIERIRHELFKETAKKYKDIFKLRSVGEITIDKMLEQNPEFTKNPFLQEYNSSNKIKNAIKEYGFEILNYENMMRTNGTFGFDETNSSNLEYGDFAVLEIDLPDFQESEKYIPRIHTGKEYFVPEPIPFGNVKKISINEKYSDKALEIQDILRKNGYKTTIKIRRHNNKLENMVGIVILFLFTFLTLLFSPKIITGNAISYLAGNSKYYIFGIIVLILGFFIITKFRRKHK